MRIPSLLTAIVVCFVVTSGLGSDPNLRLNEAQVVTLADAYAKREGYHLSRYIRSKPTYHSDIGEWSVAYEPKGPTRTIGDDFSVFVSDRTRKASIIPGR